MRALLTLLIVALVIGTSSSSRSKSCGLLPRVDRPEKVGGGEAERQAPGQESKK
jgi:hypothetical protein